MTLSDKCWISYGKSQKDNNKSLRLHFVKELHKSTNNRAGCKRYVNGSFIAFPEMFLENPLVIDSSLIDQNQQVVLQIREKNDSAVIGLQSSIRIQHINGVEYSCLKQSALKLGQEIKSLHGNNCVRDKKHHLICVLRLDCHLVSMDQCMLLGHMLICIHQNIQNQFITRDHNDALQSEITEFAQLCIPLLKQRFHLECKIMQQALQSFDEVSPIYLGGNNGISLSINVSHNFANSSHDDSLDFGPSIVIWIMDDEANKFCDQYLVFNNVVETINNEEGKSGLLIKISDGMIMSFQGDTLWHGTTIC